MERPKERERLYERLSWLRFPEKLPPEVNAAAAPAVERLGFVPNVFRFLALRPEHLLRWWSYYEYLMRGPSGLSRIQREMIAVVVSAVNRCHYCMISHGAALRMLTEDPILVDYLLTNYRHAPVEPKERAMLDFAVKLTVEPYGMIEEDVETLRRAGWSDEDILDIAQVAAMFNFTNRLANALGWIPNPEYHYLGR
ncbi:MAG: peroxidase-related enzyme [Armatimonadetes bacterium]|nr:peroxidase-related enzyme [Armatimonadota bacterium]MDW8154349.1 peroxidase-related enzyme [Armatimonadota bacterium]